MLLNMDFRSLNAYFYSFKIVFSNQGVSNNSFIKYFRIIRVAIGAPKVAPDPLFSTNTPIAIFGSSAGANAINTECVSPKGFSAEPVLPHILMDGVFIPTGRAMFSFVNQLHPFYDFFKILHRKAGLDFINVIKISFFIFSKSFHNVWREIIASVCKNSCNICQL